MENISGDPNSVRNYVFCHFLKIALLYSFDIAQDCSLEQCLTSSRAEISRKNFVAKIGAEIIFSILILLSIHSNLLVFYLFLKVNFLIIDKITYLEQMFTNIC